MLKLKLQNIVAVRKKESEWSSKQREQFIEALYILFLFTPLQKSHYKYLFTTSTGVPKFISDKRTRIKVGVS